MAPSLVLSLKRSRKFPARFPLRSERVLSLLTKPMIKLKITQMVWLTGGPHYRTFIGGRLQNKYVHILGIVIYIIVSTLPIPPEIYQVFFDQVQDSVDPKPGTFFLSSRENTKNVNKLAVEFTFPHANFNKVSTLIINDGLGDSVLQPVGKVCTHTGELAPLDKISRIIWNQNQEINKNQV